MRLDKCDRQCWHRLDAANPTLKRSGLVGCVAGALEINEYKSLLGEAGFTSIDIEPTRVYRLEDARAFLSDSGIDLDSLPPEIDGAFISGFVRAVKPLTT